MAPCFSNWVISGVTFANDVLDVWVFVCLFVCMFFHLILRTGWYPESNLPMTKKSVCLNTTLSPSVPRCEIFMLIGCSMIIMIIIIMVIGDWWKLQKFDNKVGVLEQFNECSMNTTLSPSLQCRAVRMIIMVMIVIIVIRMVAICYGDEDGGWQKLVFLYRVIITLSIMITLFTNRIIMKLVFTWNVLPSLCPIIWLYQ